MKNRLKTLALTSCAVIALATAAQAQDKAKFDIAGGDLKAALQTFATQTSQEVLFSTDIVAGRRTKGVTAETDPQTALVALLDGTGLTYQRTPTGTLLVVRASDPQSGSAAGDGAEGTVQALIVTAQKREENIQDVPIAMSAFTQKTLDTMKIEGGPDLLKAIPNVTFTKTNFTSYNIQIRGIGTQAISATTDPAVAVAFNSTPFVRNHLFEQEFFDVERVEVLRGPQGTLYGRNATAGVVNIISAKPTDQWDAMIKTEIGNYDSRRLSGFLNVPIVGDKLDMRFAGAWTGRNGYAYNETRHQPIDGRDLYSTRFSLKFKPIDALTANFVWEHFEENDDRIRSTKQLCKKDPGPNTVDGFNLDSLPPAPGGKVFYETSAFWHGLLSQGCLPTSFYSPDAFQTPNGQSFPFVFAAQYIFNALGDSNVNGGSIIAQSDPYLSKTQPRNLRTIQSDIDPTYHARSEVLELNFDFNLTDELTLTSQTGYNTDRIHSTEDFNRFNTAPGFFGQLNTAPYSGGNYRPIPTSDGVYCDPQLGCSDKFMAEDLSKARSKQFAQEFRLTSNFDGPLNFSVGVNGTRYKTLEDYYIAFNLLTLLTQAFDQSPIGALNQCYTRPPGDPNLRITQIRPVPFATPITLGGITYLTAYTSNQGCQSRPGTYIDPNPLDQVNGLGHNYFRSENPYLLRSLAGFGEVYYKLTSDLKITAGLRWTDDRKRFENIPSWTFQEGGGYPVTEEINQEWKEWTGRVNLDWSPTLNFTDQSLFYASFSRGYKGGGANPPGPFLSIQGVQSAAAHPATFDPEFNNAFEIGSKNTLLDGGLILNGDVFFYDYKNYQISEIVDRTSINKNFNAKVWGLELESLFSPTRSLHFNFTFGYEASSVGKGMKSIDLMDRTAGHSDWVVVRPFIADTSNCIIPANVLRRVIEQSIGGSNTFGLMQTCESAYSPLAAAAGGDPTLGVGYDPSVAPNHGEGFYKDLSGKQLPNTPHWTWSLGAQYTKDLPDGWMGTLRADYYHQSQSFFRIFNDAPYDKLRGWSNVNLSLKIEQPDHGLVIEAYVKNLLNSDAITGAFLNSDDTGLTTNVFTIDPRLIGLQLTKKFDGEGFMELRRVHTGGEPYPLTIEVGGGINRFDAPSASYIPEFADAFDAKTNVLNTQKDVLDWGFTQEAKVTYKPNLAAWQVSAGFRYGKTSGNRRADQREQLPDICLLTGTNYESSCHYAFVQAHPSNYGLAAVQGEEKFAIADFLVGKDVGFGVFGRDDHSVFNAGLRYAKFNSSTQGTMGGELNWFIPATKGIKYDSHYERDNAAFSADRSFKGAGPVLSWDASKAVFGDEEKGKIAVDWSLSGGALFGRQSTHAAASESGDYYHGNYLFNIIQGGVPGTPISRPAPIDAHRSKSATVPFVGAGLGLSWESQGVKVSGGWRAERYFDALDGGIETRKTYDRTVDGPYFKIAVGFGG